MAEFLADRQMAELHSRCRRRTSIDDNEEDELRDCVMPLPGYNVPASVQARAKVRFDDADRGKHDSPEDEESQEEGREGPERRGCHAAIKAMPKDVINLISGRRPSLPTNLA